MNVQRINNNEQNFNGKLYLFGLKPFDVKDKKQFSKEIEEVKSALAPEPYDMYVKKNQWGEYSFRIVNDNNESALINNITIGQTKELPAFLKNLLNFIKITQNN